ncbi:serine hydrolase [Nonomuraea sp. FMUSA5-5]|uniref:Serine hydrolase n=1 Tax=Nonomuraea composti TaxID=2720023 RepID=A0ABX1BS14_9ACTN|nr:serine hydrolase domain-containing protein [Nonomuraea sp. FMUSA5-5]NJP98046.1 serine hydrolase [Nonomuraea sp. FMUSA5-5]
MKRRRMDRFVRAYAELGRFSGAVLVARGEKVLFTQGYGLADHERGVPNRPGTAFRIGSQTKTFTAMAILRLKERGLLGVHDPIARYLPGYPGGARITLHHLLTNSSGIPDYVTTEGFTRVMGTAVTRRELIDGFKDRPLLFEPGEGVSYSNSGWVLLGEVIERVSGLAYGDYLREHVFGPLGMTRTGLTDDAKGYLAVDGRAEPAPYVDNSRQDAAGAICSTVEDLHRWRLDVPDELVGPYVESDGIAYGYGCAVGPGRIESSGGTIGFVSVSARYPADDLFVCVLSNVENAAFSEIERGLAAIARGEPYELPGERVFVTVDPALFDRYAGRYTMRFLGRTSTMDVTREGARLMVEVHGLARTELRPMSPTRFFARMKGEVELDFRADGEVALNWAGRDVTARRVS